VNGIRSSIAMSVLTLSLHRPGARNATRCTRTDGTRSSIGSIDRMEPSTMIEGRRSPASPIPGGGWRASRAYEIGGEKELPRGGREFSSPPNGEWAASLSRPSDRVVDRSAPRLPRPNELESSSTWSTTDGFKIDQIVMRLRFRHGDEREARAAVAVAGIRWTATTYRTAGGMEVQSLAPSQNTVIVASLATRLPD